MPQKGHNRLLPARQICKRRIGNSKRLQFAGKQKQFSGQEKGLKKEWFANDKFALVVGYAPGVRVRLNGVEIDVRKNAKKDISEMTLGAEDLKTIKN